MNLIRYFIKYNQTASILLCFIYFIWHVISKLIHDAACKRTSFLLKMAELKKIACCKHIPHFVYPSVDGHLNHFCLLAIENNAATNTDVQVYVWLCSQFFCSRIAGLCNVTLFEEPPTHAASNCTTSHAHRQCMRASISPHPLNTYFLFLKLLSW